MDENFKVVKTIFREYDIRGEYNKTLDEKSAYLIGKSYGTEAKRLGKTKCIVGHDNRLSGKSLTNALLKGILDTGLDVLYIGLVTTPMFYFAGHHLNIDNGIMVTASHNPKDDNGFKIVRDDYYNACGEEVTQLYDIIQSNTFEKGKGSLIELDIKDAYIKRIIENINLKKRLKIVIDPANGTGSIVVKDIFDKLNVDAIYINEISDGTFPNHHPDPSVLENMKELQNKVLETHADLGLALDGDADRLGVVDELGRVIPIDSLMCIFWDDIMPKISDKTAVFDVKCSKLLEDEILRLGGMPYLYRTGASYVKNKIREMNYKFGGELSGHLFFNDSWYGFDDGIYAGLRLLEILSSKDIALSQLNAHLNKYYSTPEIKIPIEEDKKFKVVDYIKEYCINNNIETILIDGVRAKYPDGWALVRASNTGPNLTLRFEATSEERLEEVKSNYLNLIEKAKEVC